MTKQRYLMVLDFDQTLFDTFSPNKNKIGVKEAYALSLTDIFNNISYRESEEWLALSGLIGSAPSEMVAAFLRDTQEDPSFLDNAKAFFNREKEFLQTLLPIKEPLVWSDESPQTAIAGLLVAQKLRHLLNEIGQNNGDGIWPSPCAGALDFMMKIKDLKDRGVPLDFGVVSSGHEAFIRKTLDAWEMPQPDVLVTEDDIRYRKYPSDNKRRFKPGTFPIGLAHYKWINQWSDLAEGLRITQVGEDSRRRIMVVGDSVAKDMVMAQNALVDSHYLVPFTPLQAITDMIERKKDFFDGRPFSEITKEVRGGQEIDILKPDNLEASYRPISSMERR